MKRPVTLVLVASLLISASALAGSNGTKSTFKERVATKVAQSESAKRGNDRGHDNRGNDHRRNDGRGHDRGNDHRGNDPRGNDHRGSDRRHDNDRRDWNDHRNDNDRNGRNDHRNDHNRRDWNDNRRDNNRNNWSGHRGWDRPRHDWNNHPNYWDNRRHDRRDYARYRFHFGFYRAPHGYHYRTWHRGDYLPRSYYSSSYIVYDWRPYRLYAPPYGYHWVRVGNDVLLTALATGVVLDVIYDIWY
jgi:Ni/Co efflux regulator RcnB